MTIDVPHSGAPPVTPAQWRLYLSDYDERYLGDSPERIGPDLSHEDRPAGRLGRAPASEVRLAATERRLGVPLPPSLRGFLMASDGWRPVPGSGWMPSISSCEEIDWLRNTHESFVAAYLRGAGGGGVRGADDFYLRALSLARGEDTVLLDTRHVSADGEYAAYAFALAFGHLDEPCASFGALIAKSRARSERIRSLLGGR